jgi:hypothetical protein
LGELKMEKEYDFSNGVRGKFYNKDAEFQLPIYLEPEIESFLKNLAQKQKTNLNDIVNKLLLKDKELLEMANLKG